jgi:hypothetical protein
MAARDHRDQKADPTPARDHRGRKADPMADHDHRGRKADLQPAPIPNA